MMRLVNDDKLDDALYQWFVQQRSLDMLVSGLVLCENTNSFTRLSQALCYRLAEAGHSNFANDMDFNSLLCKVKRSLQILLLYNLLKSIFKICLN